MKTRELIVPALSHSSVRRSYGVAVGSASDFSLLRSRFFEVPVSLVVPSSSVVLWCRPVACSVVGSPEVVLSREPLVPGEAVAPLSPCRCVLRSPVSSAVAEGLACARREAAAVEAGVVFGVALAEAAAAALGEAMAVAAGEAAAAGDAVAFVWPVTFVCVP